MNNIGIIVAMQEELDEVLSIMNNITKKEINNMFVFEGNIENKSIIVIKCGVGKVNAARVTQILIDKLKVDYIINIGTAGALNSNLNIGDIVVADKLVQHDFDITAFGHKKGYITGVGDYIYCDKKLLNNFNNIIDNLSRNEYKVVTGTIASGDSFCTDIKTKDEIYSMFKAECVEMEGAAVAQVCYLENTPFIVLRSISDSPNGNNAIIFDEFVKVASKRCAKILKEILKNMS